jgi:hypothetical protein
MKRRSFLAAFAVLPMITALAGTRLPRLEKQGEDSDGVTYWMANDQFYAHDGVALTSAAVNGHPFCNQCTGGADLTEESLEQLCIEIRKMTTKPLVLRPDRRIVSPAEYAWMHRSWLERLLDRIFYA